MEPTFEGPGALPDEIHSDNFEAIDEHHDTVNQNNNNDFIQQEMSIRVDPTETDTVNQQEVYDLINDHAPAETNNQVLNNETTPAVEGRTFELVSPDIISSPDVPIDSELHKIVGPESEILD